MDTYFILPATSIVTTGLFRVTSTQLPLSTHGTVPSKTPAPPLDRCAFLLAQRSKWTNAGPFQFSTIYTEPNCYGLPKFGQWERRAWNVLESSVESKYTWHVKHSSCDILDIIQKCLSSPFRTKDVFDLLCQPVPCALLIIYAVCMSEFTLQLVLILLWNTSQNTWHEPYKSIRRCTIK